MSGYQSRHFTDNFPAFYGAHASADDDVIAKNRDESVERGAKEAQRAADAIEAIRRAQESDKTLAPNRVAPKPIASAPLAMPIAPDVTKREHARAMQTILGD